MMIRMGSYSYVVLTNFLDTCPSQSIERFEQKGSHGTCVFPFTRNSVVYNSCAETKKYDGIGWCAWDSEFKEDRWGYCTPSCPNGLIKIILNPYTRSLDSTSNR